MRGDAPFYNVYRCRDDRFVAVGAVERKFYAALCTALDLRGEVWRDQLDRWSWARAKAELAALLRTRIRDE
jgi:alpha-methylacyl-CoA racemase